MAKIHVEWGMRALDHSADVAIIVDCLSFSSALNVACSRGAIVYPFSLRDGAKLMAEKMGIEVVGKRNESALSLSPLSLNTLNLGDQIILPSPNGSNLSLFASQKTVLCGALRNARAVAAAAATSGDNVIIVAAGERWQSDGSLRPALEDWLAAGAIASYFPPDSLSIEAKAAVQSFNATRDELLSALNECESGQELIGRGFAQDVDWAAKLNANSAVPKLSTKLETYADLGLTTQDVANENVLKKQVRYYSAL